MNLLLLHQLFFVQCSEITLLTERQRVDRRRVEDAFFQYALLKTASWYPHRFDITHLAFHCGTTNTISKFTTIYHGAFMEKYSGIFLSHCGVFIIFTSLHRTQVSEARLCKGSCRGWEYEEPQRCLLCYQCRLCGIQRTTWESENRVSQYTKLQILLL